MEVRGFEGWKSSGWGHLGSQRVGGWGEMGEMKA